MDRLDKVKIRHWKQYTLCLLDRQGEVNQARVIESLRDNCSPLFDVDIAGSVGSGKESRGILETGCICI